MKGRVNKITWPFSIFNQGWFYAVEHMDVREQRLTRDGFMLWNTWMCESSASPGKILNYYQDN